MSYVIAFFSFKLAFDIIKCVFFAEEKERSCVEIVMELALLVDS